MSYAVPQSGSVPTEPLSTEPLLTESESMGAVGSPIGGPIGGLVTLLAPAQIVRGQGILSQVGELLRQFGTRPLVIGGDRTLAPVLGQLRAANAVQAGPVQVDQAQAGQAQAGQAQAGQAQVDQAQAGQVQAGRLEMRGASYAPDCCETTLARLRAAVVDHRADFIIGVGGGKALDTAKLVAHQCRLPVVTIPTSGATCAAWSALSNVYSEAGAFLYDVGLRRCPELLILDYDLLATAPQRLLVAGIGDALAKWYEASVSSGASSQTLVVGAVQQARVLRDILFQRSAEALREPGGEAWREAVDASVLMAGVIGGLGGAQCRTVAAHAVHNGLTHLLASHGTLHGEKVAYGILVQLRLEEMVAGSQLAATARQQLLKFYGEMGLPTCLEDLGLGQVTLAQLQQAAAVACLPTSDIHHLPFAVSPVQVVAAMVSTIAPTGAPGGLGAGALELGL